MSPKEPGRQVDKLPVIPDKFKLNFSWDFSY